MDNTKIVQNHYDSNVEAEWARIANRPEFLLTCRFLDRYVRPGERVLDIGGGPGRYSLYLAQKGCEVTLLDLSPENVKFARREARRQKLALRAVAADARAADAVIPEQFDHVLLMGPLYHLQAEVDRIQAVRAALRCLKPGGLLFASFINMFAGIIYALKDNPQAVLDPFEQGFYQLFIENKSFAGKAFTEAYFAAQHEILPFMAQFPLEKLHFFTQEGILAPNEKSILAQSQEIIDAFLDLSEKICEREDLLSWGEHLMYIGKKEGTL